MNLNTRLEKLREEKRLLIERLHQAEAKASTRRRKQETRAKIIWGAAFLALPEGEREAMASSLLHLMTERDRRFVTEFRPDDQPADEASSAGPN